MGKIAKRHVLVIGAIVAVVAVASFAVIQFGFLRARNSSAVWTSAVKAGVVLTVNDIQADPSAYAGTITVTGVMAGVSTQDPKIFVIIDTSEAQICKTTGCARFYLPVRNEGTPPKVWDEVNVTGSLVGGRILVATKVDVLRHLFGGS